MQHQLTQGDTMKEIISTITSRGQVTIPVEVRRHLGVGTNDKISFVIGDQGEVHLKPPHYSTIESLRGAAGSLKKPVSKAKMLEIAHEEAATGKSHRDL
jgi:AbrB family looped-hinge helix DNA binding protein